jgi:hypothetical protein
MASTILVIDLSSQISPEKAVANLSGLKFKRVEHRLKRYARSGRIAEAYLNGPLKVYALKDMASLDNAHLLARRWLTLADFPWSSHMESETILLRHTVFVTHRVSVVCDTGYGPEDSGVRIEWDFATGKRVQDSRVVDDHSDRVDYILKAMGVESPSANLVLGRLKRERSRATEQEQEQEQEQESQGISS